MPLDSELIPRCFFIVGPTASGKSALAAALAERIGGEIVNADAFQLYAGLEKLTAQPGPDEIRRAPHHLYGVLPLAEACDAQRYHDLALPVIASIVARGRQAILVGGSGLYIKALTHGLSPLPPANAELRAQLATQSAEEKRRQLLELDPAAASNVPLSNPRYVDRALEICLLTGRPQSELRQSFQHTPPGLHGVFLDWPRAQLHARIAQRSQAMVQEGGLLDEVRLLEGLDTGAAKAIGVREARAYLTGEVSQDEMTVALQQATRQYAKRQITWFRRETWLQTICLDSETTAECLITTLLDRFPCLLSPPPTSP
jgi:tRNA dimethylallyltransferase